jgi:DNA-binding MarR family transcriptional regulator
LRVLGRDDGQVLGRLAEATGVRAPTVTKTVNRLAAQGIVEKRASGDDGRLVHVHLTDAGRDRLSGIEQALDATEAAMLGDLSAKEAKVLAKLLRRLQRSLVAADALGAA